MEEYLAPSEFVDSLDPAVLAKALFLKNGMSGDIQIAASCYRFVRDEIRHSQDCGDSRVTRCASDVLKYGTGFCYAKSHLLAALLRASGIPAALCYQRLRTDCGSFALHGLNAIHLADFGWYRVDPRGNKPGVNAQFSPPKEQLAFTLGEGEEDVPGFWITPLQEVIDALNSSSSSSVLGENLPDLRRRSI